MFAPREAKAPAETSPKPQAKASEEPPVAEQPVPADASWDFSRIAIGSGRPLDPASRGYFEPRFGQDFSGVRVHADASATRSASSLAARAYTVGESIVFNDAEYSPHTPSGRQLLAHELAHVVQQRRGGAAAPVSGDPGLEAAAQSAADQIACGTPVSVTGAAAVGIARQPQNPGAQAAQPVGDAVRPKVEALLKEFAAASSVAEKNRIGMQAVQEVIRAYGLSTQSLSGMRYDPGMTKYNAVTNQPRVKPGTPRHSSIDFGPGSFDKGYEYLVHVVVHELEHVMQNLIGDYRLNSKDEYPAAEFLAYTSMVLQAGPTPGRPGRGLLGELKAPTTTPALPALPPEHLAGVADRALTNWQQMTGDERARYWPQFEAARDKLLARFISEAPPALRPPTSDRTNPQFAKWRDGVPEVYDPISPAYDEVVAKSEWSKVKDQWKKFDAVTPPPKPSAKPPIGGVVSNTPDAETETEPAEETV